MHRCSSVFLFANYHRVTMFRSSILLDDYSKHAKNRSPLQWRHNDHDGVSNHQPHGCSLNRLFRRRSKKISKLRVTGLCVGNSPGTGEFPAQMASNAENVSIWWRHHDPCTVAVLCSYLLITIALLCFVAVYIWTIIQCMPKNDHTHL